MSIIPERNLFEITRPLLTTLEGEFLASHFPRGLPISPKEIEEAWTKTAVEAGNRRVTLPPQYVNEPFVAEPITSIQDGLTINEINPQAPSFPPEYGSVFFNQLEKNDPSLTRSGTGAASVNLLEPHDTHRRSQMIRTARRALNL
ncbi:MAG: hypothetical protein EB059_03985 [Alphaproteobacteria bacterium]|nr:hypothetical protein [Alphaproteobacteria bacterium]